MRASLLTELGAPGPGEFDEPVAEPGQAVVDVRLAGLNPIDVAIASGRFYGGSPPLPSVTGREGVGTLSDGTRVYFDAAIAPFGSMAERCLIAEGSGFPVRHGLSDELAVAFGIAGLAGWLPLAWRARLEPGETVLVLGASGTVGLVAVQAAKLLGAGRVVAAARSEAGLERARAAGADATVAIADLPSEALTAAIREAAGGGVDVTVDPVWGEPGLAALAAANPFARHVQLGQSAGAEAGVASATVRGTPLAILGHTNFAVPREARLEAYARMGEHGAAGALAVPVERIGLGDVREAFARQAASPGVKLAIDPRG